MSDPEGYRFLPHDQERCQCEGCQRRRASVPAVGSDEHAITYSWPHPDLFRADCSCGWDRASWDRDAVETAVDEHETETDDGIDWAEVARDDREQQNQDARDAPTREATS